MFSLFQRGYRLLVRGLTLLQHPFILILRFYWGWQFFQTGKGKLTNIEPVIGFFTDLKIPYPAFNAYFVGGVEAIGGLLFLVGLGARLAAIPLTIVLIVAYLTASGDAVKNIFSDPDTFFQQDPFLFLYATLLVLIFGPGFFSLDRLLRKKIGV